MSKTVQGIEVRDNYPDYPSDLSKWEPWQLLEAHEIGCRTALIKDRCMDSKFHLRAWHGQQSQKALEDEGHSHLDILKCSCYLKWNKITRRTLHPYRSP